MPTSCGDQRQSPLARFASVVERQNRFLDDLVELAVGAMGVFDDLSAHARLPEIPQVCGDRGNCLSAMLGAFEKGANLVRHLDQTMNFHRTRIRNSN